MLEIIKWLEEEVEDIERKIKTTNDYEFMMSMKELLAYRKKQLDEERKEYNERYESIFKR